ncbi:DUF2746 domain-containing protein [Gordonia desulfuricans]|uniref:DUF2746 domain-containing protein n=2 Tax=Gordonia desulfuricans TaxID=89051 RepID=A0A7K3LTY0_9ACTN|nr:DUF2746 domain-containing protein [Gordonia desulfuricans]NDK91027.1 DUF2746 domain-containing protein [Gordonia desulfuricans]
MELLVWLSIVTIPAAVTVVGLWIQSRRAASKHTELAENVGAVKEQVKNSHDTNLRDDIDEIKAALLGLDRRTARIGDEIRVDREQARQVSRDLYAQVARTEHVIAKYHPDEVRRDD